MHLSLTKNARTSPPSPKAVPHVSPLRLPGPFFHTGPFWLLTSVFTLFIDEFITKAVSEPESCRLPNMSVAAIHGLAVLERFARLTHRPVNGQPL